MENLDKAGEHSPTFAMAMNGQDPHAAEVFQRLDANHDGVIDKDDQKYDKRLHALAHTHTLFHCLSDLP
eukprot:1267938-Amphidinium_carterae.1